MRNLFIVANQDGTLYWGVSLTDGFIAMSARRIRDVLGQECAHPSGPASS